MQSEIANEGHSILSSRPFFLPLLNVTGTRASPVQVGRLRTPRARKLCQCDCRRNQTKIVGMIIRDILKPFFTPVVRGVEAGQPTNAWYI